MRGVPQIEVTFEIDSNAILTVTAQELTTKMAEAIEIDTLEFALTESQVEDAIISAAAFSEEDERDRERVIARIEYENAIADTESALKAEKNNPLYSKATYKELKKKLKEMKKWLDENPMEEPDVYRVKAEKLRDEFSFLSRNLPLPDMDIL